MSVNLITTSREMSEQLALTLSPLLGNPVIMAMVLTLLAIMTMVLFIKSQNGMFKMSFWFFLIALGAVVVHDQSILVTERKAQSQDRAESLVSISRPPVLTGAAEVVPTISSGGAVNSASRRPAIQIPSLSVNRQPQQPAVNPYRRDFGASRSNQMQYSGQGDSDMDL